MPTLDKLRRPSAVAIPVLVVALLAGCSGIVPGGKTAPAPVPVTVEQIRALTKDPAVKVVLVNVWASWCWPCREELPAIVKLQHAMAGDGLRVILVSADFDVPMDKLTSFLTSQGVDFATYQKTEKDQQFMKAMSPDWSGAIPATFVYTSNGELFDFWEGKATYETFESKVKEAMSQGASSG